MSSMLTWEGDWHVVVNDHQAGTDVIETVRGTVQVERWSLMVLYDTEHAGGAEPSTVEISFPRHVYSPKETTQLRAIVRDSIGNVVEKAPVTWTSSIRILFRSSLMEQSMHWNEEKLRLKSTVGT